MTPHQQEEVWSLVDRDALRDIASKGPAPVFAAISGAHLYGFASPDSDVDLRGAFLHTTHAMLSMFPPKETWTVEEERNVGGAVMELDWVAHDLRKFARLMTQHNGYVLEQLFSPLVVVDSPLLEELRALGAGCVTRPCVRHYLGFAKGRRKRLREPGATVKHLLYAYRVYLTGIHAMATGEVCSHLPALLAMRPNENIDALIHRKREGQEKMRLAPNEMAVHEQHLERYEAMLHEAHANSQLPMEPQNVAALDDLVVRARLRADGA